MPSWMLNVQSTLRCFCKHIWSMSSTWKILMFLIPIRSKGPREDRDAGKRHFHRSEAPTCLVLMVKPHRITYPQTATLWMIQVGLARLVYQEIS